MSSARGEYGKYARAAELWAKVQDSEPEAPIVPALNVTPRPATSSQQRVVDVGRCSRPAGGVEGEPQGSVGHLSELAVEVAWLRRSLMANGFPKTLFEPALARWEEKRLNAIAKFKTPSSPPLAELVREIESRRSKVYPELPKLAIFTKCPESPLKRAILRPVPDTGWVWYIDPFKWEVCRANGTNPWDTERCRWQQVKPSESAPLRGTYYVQGRWPDGAIYRGTLKIKGEMDGLQYPVYTVKPQNTNPGNPIFYGDDEEPPPLADSEE